MWVLAMFDLPMGNKAAKRAYVRFRARLLQDGFSRLQFSVYVRHCASEENAEVHTTRISHFLPPDGEVRVMTITEKQYERMRIYWGKRRKAAESPPQQLELF